VLAGGIDLDGPLQILETNAIRIYTANTLGMLIGIVHSFPDFDVHAFGYDDQGRSTYRRVVPVYAQNGSLNLRPDGSFTYAPNPFFDGADGFQFVVSD
jgi:hypothetical protein